MQRLNRTETKRKQTHSRQFRLAVQSKALKGLVDIHTALMARCQTQPRSRFAVECQPPAGPWRLPASPAGEA